MTAVGFKPTPLRGWKRRGQKIRGREIKGNGSEEKRFYKREISREKAKRWQEKYMVHVSGFYCGKSRTKCILLADAHRISPHLMFDAFGGMPVSGCHLHSAVVA